VADLEFVEGVFDFGTWQELRRSVVTGEFYAIVN